MQNCTNGNHSTECAMICNCIHVFVAQTEGKLPLKAEEEEQGDKGKEKQDDGNELVSRVQELESELKKSEENRFHDTLAMESKLKASRDEVDRVHQEMTNLKERLLQVRKIIDLMLFIVLLCVIQTSLSAGGSTSYSTPASFRPNPSTATSPRTSCPACSE